MSTAVSPTSSSGLPPPHRRKRSSPSIQPVASPALSPSSSPLAAPAQPKRARKAKTSPTSGSSLTSSPLASSTPSAPPPPAPPTTYFCYLLRSLSPRHAGHTYIGFTTDPLRRLRQHNGDITAGANRTARRRPWQLCAAVSGFTSKVIALQFEWQWTYPRKSKRMRAVMEGRRWGGGVRGKVEVMYELLATQPWQSMPLQVRYAEEHGWGVHELVMRRSEKESREWEKARGRYVEEEERRVERMKRHIYALPDHMPLTVGPFDQLDMYTYKRLRRERRKGSAVSGGATSVTPGEYGESELDDALLDDDVMVSGEESNNSGESDVEIIQHSDDDDDWTSYQLTQPAAQQTATMASSSASTTSRPSSTSATASSAVVRSASFGLLRCGLCFRRSEVSAGGHAGFFSGCDQCRFVGHLTCIVQHIFRQMQRSENQLAAQHDADFVLTQPAAAQQSNASALSPLSRSASNPTDLFLASPAFPPTVFSSVPTSLPLLPPLSTGTCPTCSAALSYPLLIERCRYMHEGVDGRRGGDVWYEEADELSISLMVREYAGRAGELKAMEKEEQALKKKADGEEKRKRKAKSTAAADSGSESGEATDSSASSPKPKRKATAAKQTRKQKKAETSTALSPPALSRSHPQPQPTLSPDSSTDKENMNGEQKADSAGKRKPTASRRVAMHSDAAPQLFASSQPQPITAPVSTAAPVHPRVSLSDDDGDDVLLVDELPSADKRRLLMAEAAERRLAKASPTKSRSPTPRYEAAQSDVSLVAVRGSGGIHTTEAALDASGGRDYVQLDDDSDDVLALDTETEEELSGMSLTERLKAKAEAARLVASLRDIQ